MKDYAYYRDLANSDYYDVAELLQAWDIKEERINKLLGVLIHIRNSAAPYGYIYRMADEAIACS